MAREEQRPLRGREHDLALLQKGLREPAIRIVAISGESGVGKSALAEAGLRALEAPGPLVGRGKFEPDAAADTTPVLLAIDSAVEAALERLYDPDAALDGLAHMLGSSLTPFAALPRGVLRRLAVPTPASGPPLTAEAADERLIQTLHRLVAWLASVGEVVLVLDDWGRADTALLAMLARMLAEEPRVKLLVTERTDEAPRLALDAPGLSIALEGLTAPARRRLIADLLDDDAAAADEVAAYLGDDARLPFDIVQQVSALREAGALVREAGRWSLSRQAATATLGEAVADLLVARLTRAGPVALALAQALAVFGGEADLADLAAVTGVAPEVARAAASALEGLGVVEARGDGLRFAHDRLRAAVRDGLAVSTAADLATAISEGLRARGVSPAASGRGAVMLQSRLMAGLDDADPAAWSGLFTEGAARARTAGARPTARAWTDAALTLGRRAGQAPAALLREAVFVAIDRSDYAAGQRFADEMFDAALTARDRAEADEMRILVQRATGDVQAAALLAREAMGRIGLKVPRQERRAALLAAALRVLLADVGKARRKGPLSPEELEVYAPIIRAHGASGSLLYEKSPMLAVLFGANSTPFRMAAGTAAGAATYSALCTGFGAFRRAKAWAQLSDDLQAPGQPMRATAMHYATNFGMAMASPRQSGAERLLEMERLAYAEGDLPAAAYANRRRVLDRLFSEGPLEGIAADLTAGLRVATRLRDTPTLTSVVAMNQVVECLAGDLAIPWRLAGSHFDDAAFTRSPLAEAAHLARHVHALAALVAVSFGAYETAADIYRRSKGHFGPPAFQLLPQTWGFATGLALFRTGSRPAGWRLAVLRHHARHNPVDHRHRVALLSAEAHRMGGRRSAALASYETALAAAAVSGCAIEHGIVANAAFEGASLLGDDAVAARFQAERDQVWRRFGARAVLRHLGIEAPASPAALEPAEPAPARQLELTAAREVAERASRAKSRLLADVAHELRTPLQGAVGMLETAGAPDGERLEVLKGALRHLVTVIDDVADLGALDAGGISLRALPFDVVTTARHVSQMHMARVPGRHILLDLDQPPSVVGDQVRLRQVLSNLVANALKHGEGDVAIALRAQVGEMVRLTFTVTDQGPGVEPEQATTIFEPFQRGAEEADGLGLGLPIARRIARAMRGDLVVSPSASGGRFVFRVDLPRAVAGERPLSDSRRVLLVEDVALSRRVLARLLTEQGCTVVEAADAETALQLWAEQPFDLLVTDQRLPGLHGSELAAQVRGAGATAPILLACGADEQETRDRVAGLSGVTVLAKPLTPDQLRGFLGGVSASKSLAATVSPQRLDELADALGPAAGEILLRVRPQLLSLLAEAGGSGAPMREAAHRIAGLASHFGLEEVARRASALEAAAISHGADADPAADLAALQAAVAAVDWKPFEVRLAT